MKKARLLITTLVCAVMIMGIGYAWWTDAIDINGTASTGNMNVHFVDDGVYPFVVGTNYVTPAVVTSEEKLLECTFDDMYPGAIGVIDVKVKNDSTLPVKLNAANITVTGDTELISNMKALAYFYKTDADGKFVQNSYGYTALQPISELARELNSNATFTNMVLLPGETLYFDVPEGETATDLDGDGQGDSCVILYVDPNAPNETQNQSITFNLGLDWKQFNQY